MTQSQLVNGVGLAVASYPEIDAIDKIECGEVAAKHFSFSKDHLNLNHGSFGTYPREIRSVLRSLQDQNEAQPDRYIRYTHPERLDESRAAVAEYLGAPVDTCVFVPNATTGVNTVLRNLVYQPGDAIIYFATIYGACHKTIEYLTETTPVTSAKVEYSYPISDKDLCSRFEKLILDLKSSGKNPRLALFDTIVSLPGLRMPFEDLTALCKKHSLLSVIDGAHSIGQIPIDLSSLDPDFYTSNLHKWLYVPRGCAVFYTPIRNQHLMRSTLPTSHGFVPKTESTLINPLPPSAKGEFVNNFEFTGTIDTNPYLCAPAALAWRSKFVWTNGDETEKGEGAIRSYCFHLSRLAGKVFSSSLGSDSTVLENDEKTLGQCFMSNISLPIEYSSLKEGVGIAQWISETLVKEYNTFLPIFLHANKLWTRVSAQVYLTEEDLEKGAKMLKEVCERAKEGEWKA